MVRLFLVGAVIATLTTGIASTGPVRCDEPQRTAREKFNEEWRAVMEQLEHGCDLCGPGPLNYPDDWDEVSERESAIGSR